jgi:hypothetical protein
MHGKCGSLCAHEPALSIVDATGTMSADFSKVSKAFSILCPSPTTQPEVAISPLAMHRYAPILREPILW